MAPPPPPALPNYWKELLPVSTDQDDIKLAFKLLKDTFPGSFNYENLNPRMIMRKMGLRDNSSARFVSGLRLFRRINPNTSKMHAALFFFVRIKNTSDEGYWLSVGVDGSDAQLTGQILFDGIWGVCQHLAPQEGCGRIEFVVQTQLPANQPALPNGFPPEAAKVQAAFNLAPNNNTGNSGTIRGPRVFSPKAPWPSPVQAWLINP